MKLFTISNYHPASVLSIMSKTYEVVYKQLHNYLAKHILVNHLHGFRNNKLTANAVLDQLRYRSKILILVRQSFSYF